MQSFQMLVCDIATGRVLLHAVQSQPPACRNMSFEIKLLLESVWNCGATTPMCLRSTIQRRLKISRYNEVYRNIRYKHLASILGALCRALIDGISTRELVAHLWSICYELMARQLIRWPSYPVNRVQTPVTPYRCYSQLPCLLSA